MGRWEVDRGPQGLAYDFWWHLGHDTLISSEWGTPNKIESGIDPETLLSSEYGHQLHATNSLYAAWDEQFYPDGIRTWFVQAAANPDGSLTLDPNFFVTSVEHRLHQVRLDGGDTSSDSFC